MSKEIQEGNKLIAEFMGAEMIAPIGFTMRGVKFPKETHGLWVHAATDLCYHSSFEWIMPVAEKIESLGFRFKQCRKRVEIEKDFPVGIRTPIDAKICMVKEETKLLSAWQAAIQFIQWYNQQPK